MTYEMTGSRVPNLKLGFVREIRQGHPEQPWSPYEYEANARCREGMTSAPNARDASPRAARPRTQCRRDPGRGLEGRAQGWLDDAFADRVTGRWRRSEPSRPKCSRTCATSQLCCSSGAPRRHRLVAGRTATVARSPAARVSDGSLRRATRPRSAGSGTTRCICRSRSRSSGP